MRYFLISLCFILAGCGGAATVTDPDILPPSPIEPDPSVPTTPDPDISGGDPDNVIVDSNAIKISLEETTGYQVVVSLFDGSGTNLIDGQATRAMGVLTGFSVLDANVPQSATYSGSNVEAVIVDGAKLYNFDQGRARAVIGDQNSITLDQFSGTVISNTQAGVAISNQDISIKWSDFDTCETSYFCGGTVAINGDDIENKVLSANATTSAKAAYMGEEAQELGGIIYVDDQDRLNIMADFIIQRDE